MVIKSKETYRTVTIMTYDHQESEEPEVGVSKQLNLFE